MREPLPRENPRSPAPFDLTGSPLAGTNLIEAGAGTGKTYTIAGLYVRLLVESGIPVRDILVVTYTVAATEELKDRIRHRIREALQVFRTGDCEAHRPQGETFRPGRYLAGVAGSAPGQEPFLGALLSKFPGREERLDAAEKLTRAIRDFDEAAIYTIHGFCQRVLQENAFESGALFDTELITDDREIKRGIVEDFWRINFCETIPEFTAYALDQKYSPDSLLRLLTGRAFHPDVRIIPEAAPPEDGALRLLSDELNRKMVLLKNLWFSSREEAAELLQAPALKANIYGNRVPGLIAEMDFFLAAERPAFPLCGGFAKFTADQIAASVRKGQRPPDHPLFEICMQIRESADRLKAGFDRRLLSLKTELLRTAWTELARRKQQQNVMYFDDLLLRLRQALEKPGGEALARVIREKYRAALIDEFQDTDPVQYAIFAAAFRTEESILFLIGDPKQAIYSFRGADIFAYLKAASQVDAVHTLDANWRSDPALIRAVNTLFSHRENPFVFEEIAFRRAKAGDAASVGSLTIDGRCEPPLQCWFIAAGRFSAGGKPLSRGIARPLIARSVAGEIARLLSLGKEKRALLGGRPLQEGDIAILVRTNREARLCQERLSELRIPCVLHSSGNLFDSHEALEMERVLLAVISPDREDLLRAALATDMLGCDLQALEAMQQDERTWESRREGFRSYHELWRKGGLLKMFRRLLEREEVRSRLLAFPDGERRLTNLLHLSEVLHREASVKKPGMAALLKWLSEHRDPGTPRGEEHQLRLESDSRAVRIVTIHKSKGLEYPVVFCPFPWGDSSERDEFISYHDPVDRQQVCDLGSDDFSSHRQPANREKLAEEVRLLYVALTRARNRCTFVWGRINGMGRSAPAYLFHGDGGGEEIAFSTDAHFRSLSDADIFSDLEIIAGKADGNIELCEMPVGGEAVVPVRREEIAGLGCREFAGTVDLSWRIASFSMLTSGMFRNVDLPDRDDVTGYDTTHPDTGSETEPDPLLSFPGGRRSGTLLHDILEKTDFTEKDETLWAAMIAAKLRENGFDQKWENPLRKMIHRVVRHPLAKEKNTASSENRAGDRPPPEISAAAGRGAIFLSDIGFGNRLNELEFYFPLKRITPDRLSGLFREAGVDRHANPSVKRNGQRESDPPVQSGEFLKRLQFDPVRGFMKGFIDMVFEHDGRFYLADWKSNFLGDRKEHYHRDRLTEAMLEHHYLLQYHLYVMALHRYLLLRQPGYDYHSHFGGVYYLFLRGMEPAWGADYGVYWDRPERELVERLCSEMIETG
ncbi:MAG: exodeoxyribonuclease V subunit beta [Thermodesulfobacteriota bacterium]